MADPAVQDIDTQDAAMLASCLRRDQDLSRAGLRPSPLALFLPPATSPLADAISTHLADKDENGDIPFVPKAVRRVWYTSVLQGLKDHLANIDIIPRKGQDDVQPLPATSSILSPDDLKTAVKVLEYLRTSPNHQVTGRTRSCIDEVIPILQVELSSRSQHQKPSQSKPPQDWRKCYICRFIISKPHPDYPALCDPCGSFNVAESNISLPENLNLASKTALITGGRVNLGFNCALRLLRCGARTIVSTRYPLDAEARYRAEPDFQNWQHRLKIVGADFRSSRDAFQLVAAVKTILREWNDGEDATGVRLFLLINNAAQTLTDSVESEVTAIRREESLRGLLDASKSQTECGGGYKARIRGGLLGTMIEFGDDNEDGQKMDTISKTVISGKSSWAQSLVEIPYEDIINAQSVNAFVPLILCRELLPVMGADSHKPPSFPENDLSSGVDSHQRASASDRPLGYIVNVSSREGIFESRPNTRSKFGFHVHTNMSKAALNMLTETEAGQMWKTRRVAMNTVDPGYMSAAPEFRVECPIGFEDGAARILWPIAVGEIRGVPMWGRFLKHFGKVEVEVGLGR